MYDYPTEHVCHFIKTRLKVKNASKPAKQAKCVAAASKLCSITKFISLTLQFLINCKALMAPFCFAKIRGRKKRLIVNANVYTTQNLNIKVITIASYCLISHPMSWT